MTAPVPLSLDQSWITRLVAERRFIWQMDFLSTRKFMEYAKKRGLDFGWTDDDAKKIVKLWRFGWIRADLIEASSELKEPGITFLREQDYAPDLYGDFRTIEWRGEGYLNSFATVSGELEGAELLFHPFRLLSLHKIQTLTEQNISPTVLFGSSSVYRSHADHHIEAVDHATRDANYLNHTAYWNDLITIAVLAEPVVFNQIFGFYSIPRRLSLREDQDFQKDFYDERDRHATDVKAFLREHDLEDLKETIQKLCREAEHIEPSAELRRLLRLTKGSFRLERLEGRVALAMNFLSAAETIRRAVELAFDVELPEEDQSGYGWDRGSLKQYYYGSERVLHNNMAKVEFVRELGLDYNVRLRWYAEGETEWAALKSEFDGNAAVEIINLKGEITARRGKGLAFADNLMNDMSRSIYSWVSLDGDRSDNCRVVRNAAARQEMFGSFFLAIPDFEFENFTLDELVEIVCEIALERGADAQVRSQLMERTHDTTNGADFQSVVAGSVPELNDFGKGPEWGQRLMKYARRKPKMEFADGTTKMRQICEAIFAARYAIPCNYLLATKECRVNVETGRLENLEPT